MDTPSQYTEHPIGRAPNEIHCVIFEMVVASTDAEDHNQPLTMAHVCRSWRNLIISTSSLWRQITLTDNYIADMRRTEHFLPLSGQLLLDIKVEVGAFYEVDEPDEEEGGGRDEDEQEYGYTTRFHSRADFMAVVPDFFGLILPELSRWRSFRFATPDEELLQVAVNALSGDLVFPGVQLHAPQLQFFVLWFQYQRETADELDQRPVVSRPLFAGITPAIRDVALHNVYIPLSQPLFTNLSRLTLLIELPPEQPQAVFSASPNLTYLCLSNKTLSSRRRHHQHTLPPLQGLDLTVYLTSTTPWLLALFNRPSLRYITQLTIVAPENHADMFHYLSLRLFCATLQLLPSLHSIRVTELHSDVFPLPGRLQLKALRHLALTFSRVETNLYEVLNFLSTPALEHLWINFDDGLHRHVTDGSIHQLVDFIIHSQPPLKHLTFTSVEESDEHLGRLLRVLPPTIRSLRFFRMNKPVVLDMLAIGLEVRLLPGLIRLEFETCDLPWSRVEWMLCARCGFKSPEEVLPGMVDALARDAASAALGWIRLQCFRIIKGTTATSYDVERLQSTALGRFLRVETEEAVNF